jgi:Putative transposase of IS4/5 family (DUF4096)
MRYELTDFEWTAIKPMLPNKPRGVRRVNDRRVPNGIFWILRSGAPCTLHASSCNLASFGLSSDEAKTTVSVLTPRSA